MGILGVESPSFLIELLEKGGLPALTIGVLMTVFIFMWKSNNRAQAKRAVARDVAFASLQKERVAARKREADQYGELMKAYEDIVHNFIELSRESTQAITRLSERVGQCPLRNHQPEVIVGDDEEA